MSFGELEAQESVVALFKALTHPARIAILDILRDGEHCVCHLESALGLRQAYVSQQLSVLREAGIVVDQRDGLNVYYRVVQPSVYVLLDTVRQLTGSPAFQRASRQPCLCPQCALAEVDMALEQGQVKRDTNL